MRNSHKLHELRVEPGTCSSLNGVMRRSNLFVVDPFLGGLAFGLAPDRLDPIR